MRNHVERRQKYAELVRAGKHKEAQKVLESIWNRKPIANVNISIPEKDNKIITKVKEESLDSLVKIKGIGKKTVSDIKMMFKNIKSLKRALKKDNVALRDDVVVKLKEELI